MACGSHCRVPDFIRETIEQIAFEARDDQRVDKQSRRFAAFADHGDGIGRFQTPSGVRLMTGEREIVPRISDIYAAIPSMTGKMELEYEGEQIGAHAYRKGSDQTRVRRDL